MLKDIFIDIINNKKEWLKSKKGNEFEDRFETSLKRYGFNRRAKEDIDNILSSIKKNILDKKSDSLIDNTYALEDRSMEHCFVCQPYGSQEFPDFLIFASKKIIPIEIKYSSGKSSKPMWNSNLPKANAIYIFGSYKLSDVTFFLGRDVLSMEERIELIGFFESNAKRLEEEFRKEMRNKLNNTNYKFDRGFDVYIRIAYEQNKNINKEANIDYFSHKDRIKCEENVIEFCESL
ncbi:type II restriction endonuclease [uncultured Brachyspira sp.]|uniref:type II restriction endonuclease n=1 Tax=uncultured Brachyspira sp. TaxID=221953 RepID=UPI0025EC4051|nr:type II restriction endonuclease [uncultured Brachyspira sp.]